MNIYKSNLSYNEMISLKATIWRYIDLAKLMDFITSKSLWFSKIDRFNDDKEGYLELENYPEFCYLKPYENGQGAEIITSDSELHEEDVYEINNLRVERFEKVKKNIKNVYVNSWHISEIDNELMWRSYSKENNSVAIKCKIAHLIKALDSEDYYFFDIREIEYVNHKEIQFDLYDSLGPAFVKRRRYISESELRVIAYRHFDIYNGNQDFKVFKDDLGNDLSGIKVKMNMNAFSFTIVVNPLAETWFNNLIHRISDDYGFEIEENNE